MIQTKDREPVETIALRRAQWCIFTGKRGGEYIILNAAGELIVTKWHSTKRLKPTREMKDVLYKTITVAETVETENQAKTEAACTNNGSDTVAVVSDTVGNDFDMADNGSDTVDTGLVSLVSAIQEEETFFRSGEFDVILWQSKTGWRTEFFLADYDGDVFDYTEHKQRAQEIVELDNTAMFLHHVENMRFDSFFSLPEIASLLYNWYVNQVNLLSDWLKPESAPEAELSDTQQESETVTECVAEESSATETVETVEKTETGVDTALVQLVNTYADYFRFKDFVIILYKAANEWRITSFSKEEEDTRTVIDRHMARIKNILQQDENAVFVYDAFSSRGLDSMTDHDIAVALFAMYKQHVSLLAEEVKRVNAQESETITECGDTLTEKEHAIASLLPVVEAYEIALRSKYHSVILYKDAESWNAEIVGVNPAKREWATFQDKEKVLRILADHRDAVLINGFENGLGDECNTLEVIAGLLYWEYTTQAHSLSRLISQYTLPKETINPQESDKKHTTTKPDTEKASEQPDTAPWMEHIKRMKKVFAELAERWTAWWESIKKQFPELFPNEDSSNDSATTTDNKYSTCFVPVSAVCTTAPERNRRQVFDCNNRARPPPNNEKP